MQVTSPRASTGLKPQTQARTAVPAAGDAEPAKRRRSRTERTLRRIGWNLLPPLTFVAMVALFGALLAAIVWLDIRGLEGLLIAFVATAACGVLGYHLFAGAASVRTLLVFLAVIAVGALMVWLRDPGLTFYPLLTSLPFAAVAAVATQLVAGRHENRPGA